METSPWRPLFILLSWYSNFNSSTHNSWTLSIKSHISRTHKVYLWVLDLQMSGRELTTWQGTRAFTPVMGVRGLTPFMCNNWIHAWSCRIAELLFETLDSGVLYCCFAAIRAFDSHGDLFFSSQRHRYIPLQLLNLTRMGPVVKPYATDIHRLLGPVSI